MRARSIHAARRIAILAVAGLSAVLLGGTMDADAGKNTAWQPLKLGEGWVRSQIDTVCSTNETCMGWGFPSYFKDANGVVHLRGAVRMEYPSTVVIARLPKGFRPARAGGFTVLFQDGDGIDVGYITVMKDGRIYVDTPRIGYYGNERFSLDGITFRAGG